MSEDMHELLSLDDKGLSSAHNTVAKLFRRILFDLRIDRMTWDRMMRNFLTNPRSGIVNNPTKRSSERSNMNRALSRDTVTWNTFRKALNVLAPDEIELVLNLKWDETLVFPGEQIEELVYKPVSRVDELSRMFSEIITRAGISPTIWDVLVERWLNRVSDEFRRSPPDRSTERGNIRKALLDKKSYTWASFTKALSIIGVQEATITVCLKRGKKVTRHSQTFKTRPGLPDEQK